MRLLNLKNMIAGFAVLTALTITSCKDKPAENEENVAPVVSKEGNTVYVDTANVPVDSGDTKKPLLRKNSEDGGDSGL